MTQTLRAKPFQATRVLLTGATGYLGSLIVCAMLRGTQSQIVCLSRPSHDRQSLLEPIVVEWESSGRQWSDELDRRIELITLPSSFPDLDPLLKQLNDIDEVIHCAGCLDYFDSEKLQLVNVTYTKRLLSLARQLEVNRFTYISTAYSGGYRDHAAREDLHDEPDGDPTDYTRTKRQAERLVADSGLPFLIVRPSILIGHSKTGRYSGKRYGLYQQWMGLERLVCSAYHQDFHAVAPRLPLNMVHQDCFEEAFLNAHALLPDNAIIHVVSSEDSSPNMRDLWELWFEVTRPARVFYYQKLEDVPLKQIHMRQRAYLTFAQVNLEIAAHSWKFETAWLDKLRASGLRYTDVTLDSVRTCQRRFVASSDVITTYLANYSSSFPAQTRFIHLENDEGNREQLPG